jgi:hypothetical protein
MSMFRNGKNLIITDFREGLLHLCDLNGTLLDSFNPGGYLKEPSALFVRLSDNENDEEIYVADNKSILVFDSNFKLINKIGNNLNYVWYLSIDRNILYISHLEDDKIGLWDIQKLKLIKEKKIEAPLHLTFDETKLYIVSSAEYEADWDKRTFKNLNKGNFIIIMNKFDLKTIHKIQFDNWLSPWSIYLSCDGHIYTLAHEMDKHGHYSHDKYLMVIDNVDYKISKKIELKSIDSFYDIIFLYNKIILSRVNGKDGEIQIIHFH